MCSVVRTCDGAFKSDRWFLSSQRLSGNLAVMSAMVVRDGCDHNDVQNTWLSGQTLTVGVPARPNVSRHTRAEFILPAVQNLAFSLAYSREAESALVGRAEFSTGLPFCRRSIVHSGQIDR